MNRRSVTNANTDESRYAVPRSRRSFPRPLESKARDIDLQLASADDLMEPVIEASDDDEKQS